jgi:hypothetical protein
MLMIIREILSLIYVCSKMIVSYTEKIMVRIDLDKLQTDLSRLWEWALGNEMKINSGKSKAVSFTNAIVKNE